MSPNNSQSTLTETAQEKTVPLIQLNPWQELRQYTDARIALGRAGNSLPTQAHLAFQLDHARARDAVHLPLDYTLLNKDLTSFSMPIIELESCATTREMYLQRPDFGRTLAKQSITQLTQFKENNKQPYDLVIVITEGLSSLAITENAKKMLAVILPNLLSMGLSLAPLCIVKQGRVAVADDVGYHLKAKMSVILVGERPGLSSPDSLGIYFTYHPKPGCLESKRNCLSNIRARGMHYQQASDRLSYLIKEAIKRGYSGVDLKDETQISHASIGQNFLLP